MNGTARLYLDAVAALDARGRFLRRALAHAGPTATAEGMGVVRTSLGDVDEALPILRRARLFDFTREIYLAAQRRARECIGAPDLAEALPFPVCWFGLADGDVINLLFPEAHDDPQARGAIVLTREGLLLMPFRVARTREWSVAPVRDIYDDVSIDPHAVETLWALALAVQLARGSPRTTGLAQRQIALAAGRAGVRPPELYTVRLDARRAGHALGALVRPHAAPDHRFEVAAHHRLLVRRWPGPDPELRAAWERRGYSVVDPGEPLGVWEPHFEARVLPRPGARETVALRLVRVREHEKGPENAPLVTALRRSACNLNLTKDPPCVP